MSTSDASDEELVARVVVRRDVAAYEQLVARHQSRIRAWLRHLSGNRAEADDLAQEAFINAWLHIDSFSGRGRFSSWLMKIAYNAYLQSYRRYARERRVTRELAQLGGSAAVTGGLEASVDLPTLLAALTGDERAAVILSYGHGFSHAEIAELTGLPLGTVKSHIRRGKAKIESILGPAPCSEDSMEAR